MSNDSETADRKPATATGPAGDGARTEDAVSLELTAPEPVTAVAPADAERELPVDPEVAERIDSMVAGFVEEITGLDVHGDDYRQRVRDINGIGEREIVATSEMSNRLLDRPVNAMSGILEGKAPVGKNLVELRHTVEELNPAKYDLVHGGPRRLLGVIPFGDRVRAYFDRYAKAQGHIQGIVQALTDGRSELERDNAAIAQEQRSLWTEMESLRQYAFLAERLDEALERAIGAIATKEPQRARVLSEDVLFPVRHRRQEILTQLAVATQGYAALRVVEKNNSEVIRAVATACTTTVAALRTAVMVAQAAANQKLVSDQLAAVNDVTSQMIETTSGLLRDQTAEVEARATSPGVDIGALQRAWDNVFAALDQIDAYKLSALAAMKVTVEELNSQVVRSRGYVERLHREGGPTAAVVPSANDRPSRLSLK